MAAEIVIALYFLSRLVPGYAPGDADMAAAVKWYALAALIIGTIAVLPFALGFAAGKPLLQAIAFTLLYLWLTRATAWSGLAKVFSGLGRAWQFDETSKDSSSSNLSDAGVIVLLAGLLAFVVGATYSFEFGRWPVLIWAIVMGRSVVSPLACFSAPATLGSLGRAIYAGSGGQALAICTVIAFVTGIFCAGFLTTICVFIFTGGLIYYLSKVSAGRAGLDADLIGAAIVLTEISTLLISSWLY